MEPPIRHDTLSIAGKENKPEIGTGKDGKKYGEEFTDARERQLSYSPSWFGCEDREGQ